MLENNFVLTKILFLNLIQFVYAEPCNPNSFQFVKPPLSINKNKIQVFNISNNEELPCAIDVKYKWNIYKIEKRQIRRLPANVLHHLGPDALKYNLVNLSSLPDEEVVPYTLLLKATLIPNLKYEPSHRYWFFKSAGTVDKFQILGGKSRFHQFGSGSLWLNVSEDGGADVEGLQWNCVPQLRLPSSLSFSWEVYEEFLTPDTLYNCSATWHFLSKVFFSNQIIKVSKDKRPPELEILCVENCVGDPSKRIVLQCICRNRCENLVLNWTTEPFDEKNLDFIRIPKDIQNAVSFEPGTFNPESRVDVIAMAREATAKYSLTIITPDSELEIICLQNCDFDSERIMELQVLCKNNCQNLNYHWAVYSTNELNWPFTLKEPNNDILTFPKNTFIENNSVRVEVRSWNSSTNYSFTTSARKTSELYLQCIANCRKPQPDIPVKVKVKCKSPCRNLSWDISPLKKVFHLYDLISEENTLLTIPSNSYNFGESVTLKASDGTHNVTVEILFDLPAVEIECVGENCEGAEDPPDPNEAMVFRVNCSKNCNGLSYTWLLYPPDENAHEKNLEFIVPKGTHSYGDTVQVLVKTGVINATKTVKYTMLQPVLKIVCRQNCLHPQNPAIVTDLAVNCSKNCNEITYEWRVIVKNMQIGFSDQVIVDYLNETIRILPLTFNNEESVAIEVHSTRRGYAVISLMFRDPQPVFFLEWPGSCNQSCIESETSLKVTCIHNCISTTSLWKTISRDQGMELRKRIFPPNNPFLRRVRKALLSNDNLTFIGRLEAKRSTLTLPDKESELTLTLTGNPTPCGEEANAYASEKYTIECSPSCDNISLNWNIQPKLAWDRQTIRGIGNKTLLILPKTFEDGTAVLVTATGDSEIATCSLIYTIPLPELSISCSGNCDPPDPNYPVEFSILCTINCEYMDECDWALDPSPPSNLVQKGLHLYSITIKADTFKDGDVLQTSVWCKKGNATLKSKFVEKPPDILIRCIKNYDYNPMAETVFEVVCLRNCIEKQAYDWKITPSPARKTEYLNKKVAVVVPSFSYKLHDEVHLTVTKGKGVANLTVIFDGPSTVLVVECIENCIGGDTADPQFNTRFRVKCHKHCESPNYIWKIDQKTIGFLPTVDMTLNKGNTTMTISRDIYLNGTDVKISVSSGSGIGSLIVHFLIPPTSLKILCMSNCGFPDPYKDLKLNVTCFGSCTGGSLIWNIINLPDNFNWKKIVKLSDNNHTLEMLPQYFKDGDSLLFTVYKDNLNAELLLTFAAPSPKVFLYCVRKNCLKLNAKLSTIVNMTCTTTQCYKDNKFSWSLNPTPPGFVWNLNIKEDIDNRSITIVRGTFRDGFETVVTVHNKRGPVNSTKLRFYEATPRGVIECLENCDYDARKPTVFRINCSECYGVNWVCYLKPEPAVKNELVLKGKNFTIEESVYQNGGVVNITCEGGKGVLKLDVGFRSPTNEGRCAIIPTTGVSFETSFTIDCIKFRHPTIYKVFQVIPEKDDIPGVLLAYSNMSVISDIWLGPGNPATIYVIADPHWEMDNIIDIEVLVSQFVKTEEKGVATLKSRILGKKINDFQELIKTRQYEHALQLASLLEDHIKLAPKLFRYHYRRHILEGIISIADGMEPSQLISLVYKLAIGLRKDNQSIFILRNLMKGLRIGIEGIISNNWAAFGYGETWKSFHASLALDILGLLLVAVRAIEEEHRKKAKMFPPKDLDYPEYWDYREMDMTRHFQYMISDMVRILDVVTEMLDGRHDVEECSIKTRKVIATDDSETFALTLDTNTVKLWNITHVKRTDDEWKMRMAKIYITEPLWQYYNFKPLNTPVLYFGLTIANTKIENSQIKIFLKKPVPSRKIYNGIVHPGIPCVLKVKPIVNSTFYIQVTTSSSSLFVLVANNFPSERTILEYGNKINKIDDIYKRVAYTPLFVGIASNDSHEFNFSYSFLQCFSWHATEWKWQSDYCSPSLAQSEIYIFCECNKLSLFAGNISLPELTIAELYPEEIFKRSLPVYFYILISTLTTVLLFLLAFIIAGFGNWDHCGDKCSSIWLFNF